MKWRHCRPGSRSCWDIQREMHVFIYPQNCPQMALHCYKKALETDQQCVCALYQSVLVYRTLGNTQAEVQALRLLHLVSKTTSKRYSHTLCMKWEMAKEADKIYWENTFFKPCLSRILLLSHRWWLLPQNPVWPTLLSCHPPHCCLADHWTACCRFPLPFLSFTVWPRSVSSKAGENTNVHLWGFVYCY